MDHNSSKPKEAEIGRRDFLKLGGLAGAASVLAGCGVSPKTPNEETPASGSGGGKAVLRIAHITDMHIEPSGPGVKEFTRALRQVHALAPAVDFILNTGDSVMESLERDRDRTLRQWEAFNRVLKAECTLPIHHAIGNHDVWGWGLPAGQRAAASNEEEFGKGMALEQLGLPERYYAFDEGGWRFMVLDSTHQADITTGMAYTGKLDEAQYAWLAQQLESTPSTMPVCIVSHIPILAACEYLDGDNETSGNWVVPGAWMHIDARRICKLFWQHPNVRLCLSGHSHQVEDLRYHGAKYLTNGAICGNWWQGAYFDFPPGYVIVSLYADGSAESEFVAY